MNPSSSCTSVAAISGASALGVVTEHYTKPPASTENAVLVLLEEHLAKQDAGIRDPSELVNRAQAARRHGQLARAERLCKRALEFEPDDASTAAVLSSILRARSLPDEALTVTEPFARGSNVALLTTRAAALLDLGRADEARTLAGRAYAIAKTRGGSTSGLHALYERLQSEGA